MHQMGHLSFGDHQPAGLQALMHLWHTSMFSEAPGSNQSNNIQAKFAVRQRPPPFFFGTIADMILRTGGDMTLTDRYSQLNNTL